MFILQKEWLCLNCQTQRAVSGQLGDPVPPIMASPKKQPPAPAPGSSSTPAAVDSKPVVEPSPPPAPEAKVVPSTPSEPDTVSSCSVSEPLPDSQEKVDSKEQKEPLTEENVSEVKQPEPSTSETQDHPPAIEGEAENQLTIAGLDATAAEVETKPQISQSVASPTENLKVEPGPENSPDVAEDPRPVLVTDEVLQVPPQLEQTADSTVLTETESQVTAVEQGEPEPVRDAAGPPPPPSISSSRGEVAEVVKNVVSITTGAQQEPKPESEESQTSSGSRSFNSDGETLAQEPELSEEVKDLRDVTELISQKNKVSMEEEPVELKISQRVDEEVKATETRDEDKTVSEPVKMEAGRENEPSDASEEELVRNNAASETVNEVKADEGKLLEEETTEEKKTDDQKALEEKVNEAEWSQAEEMAEKERSRPALTAAEEILKEETGKMIGTETETVSMTDGDKYQNKNTEEAAQMEPDVIKAKTSRDALIQGGSKTCSPQTKQSQKEAEENVPVKDEDGKEVVWLIQESVSEREKSAGGDEGVTASPDCLKEEISNQQAAAERSFEDGGVAVAVVSVAEPQILLNVANEQGEGLQKENTGREEPREADDQPLGKASDGETVAQVTVEVSKEKQRGCVGLCASVENNTN